MANCMPFNSISRDRIYKAEDWAWYFSTFLANGVFPKPSTGLQVVTNEGMKITAKMGYAFINGYGFRNPTDHNITLDTADGALARIDRVVVRWDLVARDIYITVLKGTPSASPRAQEITRNTEIYDLVIADIYVGKGITTVSLTNITDQRFNTELCGIVKGTVEEIDSSVLTAKFDAAYAEFERTLENWDAELLQAYNDFRFASENYQQQAQADFESYRQQSQAEFEAWFDYMQGQLTEDAAGSLQTQIDAHKNNTDDAHTVVFAEVSERENIKSGEKLSTLFGKIAKFFTDLKTVAFTGNYNDLSNKPTIPTVPTVVDNLLSTLTTATLSANQGRVLNEKITDLLPSTEKVLCSNETVVFYGYGTVRTFKEFTATKRGVHHFFGEILLAYDTTVTSEMSYNFWIVRNGDNISLYRDDRRLTGNGDYMPITFSIYLNEGETLKFNNNCGGTQNRNATVNLRVQY